MAIMIPAEISDGSARSERILFEKLKKLPVPWRIFPQYMVDDRELDFVILMPESYSVIHLEVKGGEYSVRDRQWLHRGEPMRRGPTEQARSAMFTLQNKFVKLHPEYSKPALYLSFVSAVAFTDVDVVDGASLPADVTRGALLMGRSEMEDAEDADVPLLLGSGEVQDGNRIAQLLREHATAVRNRFDSLARWTDMNHKFAAEQLKFLEDMLNPPNGTKVTKKTFFRRHLDTLLPELLEPTLTQNIALSLIGGNDRCVIDGAAGTGKTVLAMEVVQQRCEERGDTVGLLCSNPILSSRFERWAGTLSDERGGRVVVGTPASLLAHAFADDAGFVARHRERLEAAPNLESSLKRGDLDNGWRGFVAETLTELEGKAAVFDYLVIDEAQNLCDEVFLQLLDRLVKGGLVHGRWTMFGDFVNQNIVTPRREGDDDVKAVLESSFHTQSPYYKLDTNCRNTREIATATSNITGIESPTLPGWHGPKVEFRYFDSRDQLHGLLDEQLKEWDGYGFEPKQITILIGGDDNVIDLNRQYGKGNLVNIAEAPSGGDVRVSDDDSPDVRYSSIFDFQGMESALVILVLPMEQGQTKVGGVITLPDHNYLNRLLYIAISRANAMLVVMADEGYKMHLEDD